MRVLHTDQCIQLVGETYAKFLFHFVKSRLSFGFSLQLYGTFSTSFRQLLPTFGREAPNFWQKCPN